jgi:quercetin dioxygenase-like cupin family protein
MTISQAFSSSLNERLVRYGDLRPCTNAFIDARSPGSDKKENFTIVGPGVAENPQQHVHIREPHGFNIGAARQPPGCTNSLHSHDTAEVFIIHQGTWRFFWGEQGDAGEVVLHPGDTISIPIHIFRGFENIGEDVGFMFAVLGGDDPGRVHWAPQVIEKARGYGLVLLENGSLIDTTIGETVPMNSKAVNPSSANEIAYIRTPTVAEMTQRVARHQTLVADGLSPLTNTGVTVSSIILDRENIAPIGAAHDFTVQHIAISAGHQTAAYSHDAAQVLLVFRGCVVWHFVHVNNVAQSVTLNSGDTFSVPVGMAGYLEVTSEANSAAEIFIVRGIAR